MHCTCMCMFMTAKWLCTAVRTIATLSRVHCCSVVHHMIIVCSLANCILAIYIDNKACDPYILCPQNISYMPTFCFASFNFQTDPLQKAMTAFASALGISITKLKFTFDGDPIKPTQTATELDMENDDCIDVRVIS